jgi:hypothetical protein
LNALGSALIIEVFRNKGCLEVNIFNSSLCIFLISSFWPRHGSLSTANRSGWQDAWNYHCFRDSQHQLNICQFSKNLSLHFSTVSYSSFLFPFYINKNEPVNQLDKLFSLNRPCVFLTKSNKTPQRWGGSSKRVILCRAVIMGT